VKAILSNINLDPLAALLRPEEVWRSGYGQLVPDLLDPSSGAHAPGVDAALVFLDGEELVGPALSELPTEAAWAAVRGRFDELLAALEGYARALGTRPLVVSTVVLPPWRFTRFLEAHGPWSFGAWQAELNAALRGLARGRSNVLVLDWERLTLEHGYAALHDDRFWYLGRAKLAQRGLTALKDELRLLLAAWRGAARKVLVLDADGTLWGGVLGEDGAGGIALSEDGAGKAFRDFQRAVRSLADVGVLLALCSKNDEAELLDLLRDHPMVLLRPDRFAAREVNWRDKATNLRALAQTLGLGLDAFVMIDDNPVERQLIREHVPEVAVPDPPADPARLRTWLLREVVPAYFGRVVLTEEDRGKTAQYAAQAGRRELGRGLDLAEFLARLEVKLDLTWNERAHRQRAAQLTQKTNQWNVTTRRYTDAEVEALLAADDVDVLTVSYADRFGQEGVVGLAIVRYAGAVATLDTLLLSCRVIGRHVEHRVLDAVARRARERGSTRLEAEFIPTKKNGVAAGFFAEVGLTPAGDGRFGADLTAWCVEAGDARGR
jgi:FkbH-like protein